MCVVALVAFLLRCVGVYWALGAGRGVERKQVFLWICLDVH